MAARTVVCPECSEKVPYGRLSCSACGALLASVAGGPARPAAAMTASESDDAPAQRSRRRWRGKANSTAQPAEPQAAATAAPASGGQGPAATVAPVSPAPALAPPAGGAVTLAARLEGAPLPAPSAGPAPAVPPVLTDWPANAVAGPSPWRRDGVQRPHEQGWDDEIDRHAGVNGNGAERSGPYLPPWAGGPAGQAGASGERSTPVALAATDPGPVPPAPHLAPSGAFTARDSGLARVQLDSPGVVGAPGSVGAPVVRTRSVRTQAAAPSSSVTASGIDREDETMPRPGDAPLLADLPFDAPDSLSSWLVAAGSAAAIAGFLLPWSRAIPFATGFGYFDTWGLATPSHLLVLLMAVGVLALAILPNRAPPWLRSGVAGLLLGGLLLGLIWPYFVDGLGAMVGALAEGTAGFLLVIGGFIAVRARHAGEKPVV